MTWDAIPAAKYAGFGRFTVNGTIAGVTQKALATVTVSDLVTHNQNLDRVARLKPAADASYSGAANTLPAAMIDGTTTTGGWSNAYNKAATALLPAVSQRARERVGVGLLAHGADVRRRSGRTSRPARRASQPAAYNVTYWDGGAWAPVKNLAVTAATASNQPSTLSFDPVNTNQVRIEMTTTPRRRGRTPGSCRSPSSRSTAS